MKPLFTLIAILGIAYAALGAFDKEEAELHDPPPINLIQAKSDLAALSVQIHTFIIGTNDHWQVRWLIQGEALIGTDLSNVKYKSVDKINRRVTLCLQQSHVISSKLHHDRCAELSVAQLTIIPLPGLKSLRDEVWWRADEKVKRLAHNQSYLKDAMLQTEKVLDHLFREVDWTVSYDWGLEESSPAKNILDNKH